MPPQHKIHWAAVKILLLFRVFIYLQLLGERGNRKCKLRIANEYRIAVLVIRKKTWLSASLTSRNFHPWQPSDTHRLSFDYYFFHSSCLEYRLNEVWCAFFCIFLIFAEKISKYERVLVSSTGELIAFQSWVSFFYVYNYCAAREGNAQS